MEDVFLKLKASSSVLIRYFNSYLEKKGETCKKNWILEGTVVCNNRKKNGPNCLCFNKPDSFIVKKTSVNNIYLSE